MVNENNPMGKDDTMFLKRYFLLIMLVSMIFPPYFIHATDGQREAVLLYDKNFPQIHFAGEEIKASLENTNHAVVEQELRNPQNSPKIQIILCTQDVAELTYPQLKKNTPLPKLEPQEYAICYTKPTTCWVIGGDATGAMYGGIELAEAIALYNGLRAETNRVEKPDILRRGIKFNIPLDARTPSYDDTGDAAQMNYEEMWNFEFWQAFLDNLARYRYNTLTLWNPHPFPSLVKCPNYPEAALEDVCVTTLKPTYEHGAWRDPQFVPQKVLDNLRVIKKMNIDEKIDYWRRVMQYAKDRGIDIYIITWNVIMNSAEGKYGITVEQDNPKTIAYLRESVRELILTYPLLAGIGVTAGENMKDRDDEFAKEKWLWNTYGLGILDAKEQQPDRTVRFIHRVWWTGLEEVMKEFGSKYPDPFEIGFKYARAHMYSSPAPPFAKGLLEEMEPYDVKCWWNLRNDDIFNFRWGDAEYVRAFLRNLPPAEKTAGYHMGSDGYVWGREFTSRTPEEPRQLEIEKHWFNFMLWGRLEKPHPQEIKKRLYNLILWGQIEEPRQLEIEKHWYNFMLWGRLGYDLDWSEKKIRNQIDLRFPLAKDKPLYETWSTASKIIPLVNRFHWKDWDFLWAVEGCFDQRNGFHTVDDFIKVEPMEGTNIVSIPKYVQSVTQKNKIEGISPLQVAEQLQELSDSTLASMKQFSKLDKDLNKELYQTLRDLEAMAHLGHYYAEKIRGAVDLAFYRETKEKQHQEQSVQHLEKAAEHWKNYADTASALYKPQLLARTRVLDWYALLEEVKKDVEIAKATVE